MTDELKFPRNVVMDKAGIFYTERGPNAVFINLVADDDTIRLVVTIDQDSIGNSFSAMTFGKVIDSMPLVEALEKAKLLEAQAEDD